MKYALLIYEPASEFAKRTSADAPAYWAAWSAYGEAIKNAGIMAGGAGLQPPTVSSTLRIRGTDRGHVHDGPYADSKEQLGGFFVIDVPDLDTALAWARKSPQENGFMEVRPLLSM